MAFHLAHIHDYDRFLALDIGSYRIRAGVYGIESGSLTELGFGWARQSKKSMNHGSISDLRAVSLALERAMVHASQKVESIPHDAILSFSSSTFLSDILTTQYTRSEKTKEISMDELDTIVKRIEKESFDRIKIKAKEQFGIIHDDMRLVSSTITAISIDGKNITNPIGFTGGHVRLSVLNIFAPASEFNIVRSLAANMGKKVISLVPTPLVFPKILEKSDYNEECSYILDIGYYHTHFLAVSAGETHILETFSFGANMLFDMISRAYPEHSSLEIESLLSLKKNASILDPFLTDFFEYLFDILSVSLEHTKKVPHPKRFFVSGGLFENVLVFESFGSHLKERMSQDITVLKLADAAHVPGDHLVTYGLALLAEELLVVKKDPIVRILRYVLYAYE